MKIINCKMSIHIHIYTHIRQKCIHFDLQRKHLINVHYSLQMRLTVHYFHVCYMLFLSYSLKNTTGDTESDYKTDDPNITNFWLFRVVPLISDRTDLTDHYNELQVTITADTHATLLRGSVVVKTLCYKQEGRGFDTRLGEFLNLPNPSSCTRP
jgi:hypothetical protein